MNNSTHRHRPKNYNSICLPFIMLILFGLLCFNGHGGNLAYAEESFPIPQIEFGPKNYICYRADIPPVIDGDLSDSIWMRVEWTDNFIDIEGRLKPVPRFATKAKMTWDDDYFYVCAWMEEPHVWASLTERDAVIYHDNDFEVFIDPDGDTHEYYELEVNAHNTQWDLFLAKPYRDGGPAINSWDIQGLKTAVNTNGTLNNPSDIDDGWSIEIAIPWKVLKECAHKEAPPKNGDHWRINFSRVEWQTDIIDGKYVKSTDSLTGGNLPENNWVWSPQGLIAMHYPEMWGFVAFTDAIAGSIYLEYVPSPADLAKWVLRRLYYKQQDFWKKYSRYSSDLSELDIGITECLHYQWPPQIFTTPNTFEIRLNAEENKHQLVIYHNGDIEVIGK